jgi:hypothetical protein
MFKNNPVELGGWPPISTWKMCIQIAPKVPQLQRIITMLQKNVLKKCQKEPVNRHQYPLGSGYVFETIT